ncbi:hypothetical protein IGI04_026038 [Brassica rapa subsp. trilocularis]|uniref:Uncharacterized protein n=1 Tax=Brassica rapa subsp. trilocularis TaxID=1813537 RepID=A0ABQ7KVJ5_BRACM|nr:hypothetical protein IGI04_026038 [Brassica rapa subsp. trilocularis]
MITSSPTSPEEGTFNRTRPTVQSGHRATALVQSGHCRLLHDDRSPQYGRVTMRQPQRHLHLTITEYDWPGRIDMDRASASQSYRIIDWTELAFSGSWGIYRRHQPISFRLVAARVSLRMAPDACTATPRAPHGWLHVQDTCRTPPLLPDVRMHDWSSCKATHIFTHVDQHASVACAETPRAWPFHLVLLCVKLHNVLAICIGTPRASWSVYAIFDPSGIFLSRDQSRIFFRSLSDAQNNFNKLHLISEVEGKYVLSLMFLEKFHNTEIRVFGQFWVFSSFFNPVVLASRRAYFPSCLIPIMFPMSSK